MLASFRKKKRRVDKLVKGGAAERHLDPESFCSVGNTSAEKPSINGGRKVTEVMV